MILFYILKGDKMNVNLYDNYKLKNNYPIIAGGITFLSLIISMTIFGMWPIGEKTILTVDMYAQYAPLLEQFRQNLLDGSLSLYSFNIGIGTSFLPLFAYYLSSPMNLLLLLFPKELIAEAALTIIIIKVSLTAMFFCIMLKYIYKKNDLKQVIVSIMYALSMYVVAYSWCIMWLDSVMLLPLLIFAFERMMREQKYLFFVFMVSLSIFVNYYLGFMILIFLFLYFLSYIFRKKRSISQIKISCLKFFVLVAIGISISAFLLLPVYISLSNTSAAASLNFPKKFSNFEIWKLLGRSLFGVEPTIRSKGLPNIYSGVLTVALVILFNTVKQIPLRIRMIYTILISIMFLSLILSPLDLFWHGFHSPNDLPYRDSFIYCFVLALIAYQTIINIKNIKIKNIVITLISVSAYIIIDENFSKDSLNDAIIYINLLLLFVYGSFLICICKNFISARGATAIFLIVVFFEFTFSTFIGLNQMDKSQSFALHNSYVDNEKSRNIEDAIYKIKLNDKNKFYRMETLPRLTCVDTALFNYPGITTFASSNSYKTTKLMKNLGYQSNGINSYMYKSFIAPIDSIFAIKYLVIQSNITKNNYLTEFNVPVNNIHVYENKTVLPLGFVVDRDVKNYKSTNYNPFKSQIDLYRNMGAINKDFYKYSDITLAENINSNAKITGNTSFRIEQNNSVKDYRFKSEVKDKGQVFAYIDCTAANSIKIESGNNKWDVKPNEPFIVDLGYLEDKSEVFINIDSKSSCSGNIFIVTLDEEIFRQAILKLNESLLNVTDFNNTNIKGNITTSKEGLVFTSIPYDNGWNVKVDGVNVDKIAIDDGLLAFEIPKGEHDIEFYFIPEGLYYGCVITILSIILLITLNIFITKSGKRIKNDYDNNTCI